LHLWHDLYRNRTNLYPWSLLTHKSIHHIEHLTGEISLAQCSRTSSERKRPENRERDDANSADGCLVHPLLRPDHSEHTTSRSLNRQRKSCLHTQQCLEIATFLQLHKHLILIAKLLRLIPLRLVDIC
jgi:hypothetical protein